MQAPSTSPLPLLINEAQAAQLLGVSPRLLRKDRAGPRVFPFLRLGSMVKYSPAALAKFTEKAAS